MDFNLTEQQEMLRKTARDFLEKECPKKLVREMEKDDKGYAPALWRKMAELGWMGLAFPEKYGGSGGSFLDLAVLIEEMGRALVPGPFLSTVVHCGLAILEAGTEEQKREFLPKIARGEMILALAWLEPTAGYDAGAVTVRAAADKDDYVINGTKLFVTNANVADYLLCVTRTKDVANKEDGITLFLVKARNPGIKCSLLETIAGDKQCEVLFEKVRVPKKNILGQLHQGWSLVKKLLTYGAVTQCVEMVGGAQQVLEMSVNYAKERVQFGRPIGSFQAIQHRCADMVTDVDSCKYLTWEAAWRLSQGLPCDLEVAMAKTWVSEAYRRVCLSGHQVHGAIGFSLDHDMQLYFRRAKEAELAFGDADFHRSMIVQQMEEGLSL